MNSQEISITSAIEWKEISEAEEYLGNGVYVLLEDHEGNICVGEYDKDTFTPLAEGPPFGHVRRWQRVGIYRDGTVRTHCGHNIAIRDIWGEME